MFDALEEGVPDAYRRKVLQFRGTKGNTVARRQVGYEDVAERLEANIRADGGRMLRNNHLFARWCEEQDAQILVTGGSGPPF